MAHRVSPSSAEGSPVAPSPPGADEEEERRESPLFEFNSNHSEVSPKTKAKLLSDVFPDKAADAAAAEAADEETVQPLKRKERPKGYAVDASVLDDLDNFLMETEWSKDLKPQLELFEEESRKEPKDPGVIANPTVFQNTWDAIYRALIYETPLKFNFETKCRYIKSDEDGFGKQWAERCKLIVEECRTKYKKFKPWTEILEAYLSFKKTRGDLEPNAYSEIFGIQLKLLSLIEQDTPNEAEIIVLYDRMRDLCKTVSPDFEDYA